MSRLDDLIDLMQSACETYLINPSRNGRAAYIQVDNLCELTMKTWLYEDSKRRQSEWFAAVREKGMEIKQRQEGLIQGEFQKVWETKDKPSVSEQLAQCVSAHLGFTGESANGKLLAELIAKYNKPEEKIPLLDWQPNESPTSPKSFHYVLREVKARHTLNEKDKAIMEAALVRIEERRDKRNQFFHYPALAGLTVSDKDCQHAFLDFNCLAACLFPAEYPERIKSNPVVRAHLVILRLKHRSEHTRLATECYREALQKYKRISIGAGESIFEYHALYEDAGTFYDRIYEPFRHRITKSENEISRIEGMKRRTAEQDSTLRDHQQNVALLKQIIKECFD